MPRLNIPGVWRLLILSEWYLVRCGFKKERMGFKETYMFED